MSIPHYEYGVATPDKFSIHRGREFLQAIVDGKLPQPPMCKTLGY